MVLTHEQMAALGARDGAAKIERIDPRMLTGSPWYLFNIYGIEHQINLGTAGYFFVQACPEGQEYVRAATTIPGTVEEIYPHFTDKEEYRSRAIYGEDVVKAALGIGPGQTAGEDIRRYGVFASQNAKPTVQELQVAKRRLVPELQNEIREADELFAAADPELRQSAYNQKYYRAARYLGVKKPWLSEATEVTLCPYCGSNVRPGVAICGSCNRVIDPVRLAEIEAAIAGKKAN